MARRVLLALWISGALVLSLVPAPLPAQSTSCWVVPQRGVYGSGTAPHIRITRVTAGVVILEQVATTTLDIELENGDRRAREAKLLVPVPGNAAVRGFTFQGGAGEPTASVLPREEAERIYRTIVNKLRDPALLEFSGLGFVRSSVFPVPPGGTQKVRLTYEHLLTAEGKRIDYVLPRTEALDYTVPWKVSVRIKSKRPIAAVYSPSHAIETRRRGAGIVSARLADRAAREPGAFRLSFLPGGEEVAATLLSCPDAESGGGYFLLLAGLPPVSPGLKEATTIRREVTLVLDRSGSMRGEKIEQVREAALQVLAGLAPGEAFNIITYNDSVTPFADAAVIKTDETERRARDYLRGLRASGGTDIHAALTEALRRKPPAEMLPLVLFLTDGLPTAGQTSEVAIRDVVMKANPYARRVFSFGVGVDVNTPLLEKIAKESRGAPTFVLPGEDVEVKVGKVFRQLHGPVLADASLEVAGADAKAMPPRIHDLLPDRLPDLFDGDQLVVLGRYRGEAPISFTLSGNYRGTKRAFRFRFNLDRASVRNAFVARLWASRKIGALVDALRQAGASVSPAAVSASRLNRAAALSSSVPPVAAAPAVDPKWRELVDEVVRLSTRFGILTEYTAFLAREGTDLSQRDAVLAEADRNFINRAANCRTGLASVNQSMNSVAQQKQCWLNGRNRYWDANMNRVEIATVQQIADRAFFRRGTRWVDSRLVEATKKPDRVIEFGSDAFRDLVRRLTDENRQGCVALKGEILLELDGRSVLVKPGPKL